MFDWSLTVPLLINTILVSVPEEAFLVILTLYIMRRFDLLDFQKRNIKRILYVVLPVALISNIMRGFDGIGMSLASIVGFGGIFILIVLVYKLNKFTSILKAFLAVTLSFIVGMSIQLLYMPFILYGTKITITELNKVGNLALILSLIDRAAHVCILVFLFLGKRRYMKMNFFKVIIRNKLLGRLAAVVVLLNLVFVYIMCMLIYFDKILISLSVSTQLLVIVSIIIFPLINISVVLGVINYAVNKYTYSRIYFQEEYKVLRVLVQLLLKQGKYEKIDTELGSFEKEVERNI